MLKEFAVNPQVQVYLGTGYTDLRKGIDGLTEVVQGELSLDPYSAALFLFCGRRCDRIKGLLWEGDGEYLAVTFFIYTIVNYDKLLQAKSEIYLYPKSRHIDHNNRILSCIEPNCMASGKLVRAISAAQRLGFNQIYLKQILRFIN